ncbi:hypothetical protein L7F22_066807 [Adiantum nelumboides]|nr:hypothetical protein [Adiantum nelumboides]
MVCGICRGRTFREVELSEPIRYSVGDPVEAWLNELLCLNAANHIPKLQGRLPHPSECRLYYVNRDTLFSYHKASEHFLQRMMALYVASHYKNTPNDLQLMSDAPAHHLFVLLGPVDESQNTMPDIFCVAQVCLEGKISKESALRSLSEGSAPSGDQIPWKVSEQFQDTEFPSLSGARIVRIAVHPSLVRAGYGSATVDLLARYYEGQLTDLGEVDNEPSMNKERKTIIEAAQQMVPDEDAFGTEVADRDRLAHIVHVSSAFGSLMCDLLVSRPDLAYAVDAFAVGVVSHAMTDTGIVHSGALQVVTRYLQKECHRGSGPSVVVLGSDQLLTKRNASMGSHLKRSVNRIKLVLLVTLLEEVIKPRADLPPLLVGLHERVPEKIHYLGVSFGLTLPLYNFWHRHNFWPLYIGQIPNAITGEHSCIVVRALENEELELTSNGQMKWVQPFNHDFKRRFMNLLGSCFKSFTPALALSVLDPKISFSEQEAQEGAIVEGIFEGGSPMLTPYDMKRLESYSNSLVDYHLILDLVPFLSWFYFLERLPTTLSYGQAAILLSLGLQHQGINHIEAQLHLPRNQILALFNKSIRKLHNQLHRAAAKKVEAAMPRLTEVNMNAHLLTVDEDLDDAARQVRADMKQKLEEMLNPEDLQKYAISADADNELSKVGKFPKSGFVSVKSIGNGIAANKDQTTLDLMSQKRKGKKEHGKSHSKRTRV